MDEKCHYTGCENPVFANCDMCGKPTCKETHSKQMGDKFLCLHCAEKVDTTVEKVDKAVEKVDETVKKMT